MTAGSALSFDTAAAALEGIRDGLCGIVLVMGSAAISDSALTPHVSTLWNSGRLAAVVALMDKPASKNSVEGVPAFAVVALSSQPTQLQLRRAASTLQSERCGCVAVLEAALNESGALNVSEFQTLLKDTPRVKLWVSTRPPPQLSQCNDRVGQWLPHCSKDKLPAFCNEPVLATQHAPAEWLRAAAARLVRPGVVLPAAEPPSSPDGDGSRGELADVDLLPGKWWCSDGTRLEARRLPGGKIIVRSLANGMKSDVSVFVGGSITVDGVPLLASSTPSSLLWGDGDIWYAESVTKHVPVVDEEICFSILPEEGESTLGVRFCWQNLEPELGPVVRRVTPGLGADRAGVQVGMRLVAVNGQRGVCTKKDFHEFLDSATGSYALTLTRCDLDLVKKVGELEATELQEKENRAARRRAAAPDNTPPAKRRRGPSPSRTPKPAKRLPSPPPKPVTPPPDGALAKEADDGGAEDDGSSDDAESEEPSEVDDGAGFAAGARAEYLRRGEWRPCTVVSRSETGVYTIRDWLSSRERADWPARRLRRSYIGLTGDWNYTDGLREQCPPDGVGKPISFKVVRPRVMEGRPLPAGTDGMLRLRVLEGKQTVQKLQDRGSHLNVLAGGSGKVELREARSNGAFVVVYRGTFNADGTKIEGEYECIRTTKRLEQMLGTKRAFVLTKGPPPPEQLDMYRVYAEKQAELAALAPPPTPPPLLLPKGHNSVAGCDHIGRALFLGSVPNPKRDPGRRKSRYYCDVTGRLLEPGEVVMQRPAPPAAPVYCACLEAVHDKIGWPEGRDCAGVWNYVDTEDKCVYGYAIREVGPDLYFEQTNAGNRLEGKLIDITPAWDPVPPEAQWVLPCQDLGGNLFLHLVGEGKDQQLRAFWKCVDVSQSFGTTATRVAPPPKPQPKPPTPETPSVAELSINASSGGPSPVAPPAIGAVKVGGRDEGVDYTPEPVAEKDAASPGSVASPREAAKPPAKKGTV
eukprot:TRINITY_DN14727_c0_g1_i2.p1 TRINITY_DN14727_c0_g1~~TRINITY_DN14727_c0_g1_i2.p1  ORF type:complete len:976 (+),score=126.51 TRINITY_DN14727_c0_g1_i2:104-3031(+)